MKTAACSLLSFSIAAVSIAQTKTTPFLKHALLSVKDTLFQHMLNNPGTYHYQINYTGINWDKYEYAEVGLPFFYTLGQHLYRYELKRKRKYTPNLSRFTIAYEQRVPDERESIKDADN